jgi:hypothetical protein
MPGTQDRKLKYKDMSDKFKSRLSAIFLPKATYSMPAPNMSAPSMQDQPRRTSTGSTGYRVPIILTDHDMRQRRQQMLDSESARGELLKHGIKVRDFQVEADAKRFGGLAQKQT